ncbi:MAG TPA: hypothetical protein VHK88_19895 [Aquihabitans sp.]|jgi:hypothetical protein|nr:hypothetical protein [Aquihabitans sp.]
MAYCGPRGIPYLHWLGGRDLWDELSRAAAIAWAERDADRCPGCGLHRSDLPADPRHDLPVEGAFFNCRGCEVKNTTKQPDDNQDKARNRHFFWRHAAPKAPRASRRRRPDRARH